VADLAELEEPSVLFGWRVELVTRRVVEECDVRIRRRAVLDSDLDQLPPGRNRALVVGPDRPTAAAAVAVGSREDAHEAVSVLHCGHIGATDPGGR
jgi:hypothetical protein